MGSLADKANKIASSVNGIRAAILYKGQACTDSEKLSTYGDKIRAIQNTWSTSDLVTLSIDERGRTNRQRTEQIYYPVLNNGVFTFSISRGGGGIFGSSSPARFLVPRLPGVIIFAGMGGYDYGGGWVRKLTVPTDYQNKVSVFHWDIIQSPLTSTQCYPTIMTITDTSVKAITLTVTGTDKDPSIAWSVR